MSGWHRRRSLRYTFFRHEAVATGNETYSYAAGFKLTSVSHSGGGADDGFTYDSGGRVTGIDRDGTSRKLDYDSQDRITRVRQGVNVVAQYSYDGLGRRIGIDDGAGSKRRIVAPNMGDGDESPQAVLDESGAVSALFVYGNGDAPLMEITPQGVQYPLTDAAGSVIGKADGTGHSTALIKYDAFGNVVSAIGTAADISPAIGSEPRFHGMNLDATTGLYFVRARFYDARTGRFLSRDSFIGSARRPESQHPYVFNSNNAFKWRDPSGRFSLGEISAASAVSDVMSSIALPSFKWAMGWLSGENHANDQSQSAGVSLCVLDRKPTGQEMRDATNQWLNGLAPGSGGGPGGNFIYWREADAFGHCWAGCVLCRRCGEFATAVAGWGRELKREWWDDEEHDSFWQDIDNQSVGRDRSKGSGTCGEECAEAHASGELDLTAPRNDAVLEYPGQEVGEDSQHGSQLAVLDGELMVESIDSQSSAQLPRPRRKRVFVGVAVVAILLGGLQLARRVHQGERRNMASIRAMQEAGLSAIPDTAETHEAKLHCSLMFCNVKIAFSDRNHLDAWVKNSASLQRLVPKVSETGIREYMLAGKGKSPSSSVAIDDRAGTVMIDVSIERERCDDICGD